MTVDLHLGDCLSVMRGMPDASVHCIVTSPPYWGLRDYGVEGQLGLESTPEEYVAKMTAVFREARRVLRDDGTLWLNIGDSYAGDIKGSGGKSEKQDSNAGSFYILSRRLNHGLKQKDLCGIPWRLAFALQADGWYLRQDIIWHKPNPMPESVTDRCTKSHEYVFLLSKSARYFYDAEAVKEPVLSFNGFRGSIGLKSGAQRDRNDGGRENILNDTAGRNRRSVWTIPTAAFSGAHFATYPPALVEPCILAGTSAQGCCPKCGAQWEREVESNYNGGTARKESAGYGTPCSQLKKTRMGFSESRTIGWLPACQCPAAVPVPATVLDPFLGSGTTAIVAIANGRNAIGIELSPEYMRMAKRRINQEVGLLAQAHGPRLFAVAEEKKK